MLTSSRRCRSRREPPQHQLLLTPPTVRSGASCSVTMQVGLERQAFVRRGQIGATVLGGHVSRHDQSISSAFLPPAPSLSPTVPKSRSARRIFARFHRSSRDYPAHNIDGVLTHAIGIAWTNTSYGVMSGCAFLVKARLPLTCRAWFPSAI